VQAITSHITSADHFKLAIRHEWLDQTRR